MNSVNGNRFGRLTAATSLLEGLELNSVLQTFYRERRDDRRAHGDGRCP